MCHNFYTENVTAWEKALSNIKIYESEPSYVTVCNGLALPPRERKRPCGAPRVYEGGICGENGKFVAGLTIDSKNEITNSCLHAYKTTISAYRNESVVFGGLLIQHFGHMLVDSLNRLWFLGKKWSTYKIIFMIVPFHTSFPYNNVVELLNLDKDSFEIIDKPTKFREIIVPEESCISVDGHAHKEWLTPFDIMSANARSETGLTYDKLYLTRRMFSTNDGINEEQYEDFYRQQGFHVIAPESMPFYEQVYLISHANEISCTIGSLSHILLFCKKGIRVNILLRDPKTINTAQLLINRLKNFTCNIIEATKNILPTYHVGGTFLYCQTKYFQSYCDINNITLNENRISDELIVEYIKKWTMNYSTPERFSRIADKTAADFVDSLTKFFGYPEINLESFNKYHKQDIRIATIQMAHNVYNSISYKNYFIYSFIHVIIVCIKKFVKLMKRFL